MGMTNDQKHLHSLNIANAAKIGKMRHGEFLSLGVGKFVFEIFCWQPLNYSWLVYDFEIKDLDKRVKLIHRTSLEHTLIEFAKCAETDIEK